MCTALEIVTCEGIKSEMPVMMIEKKMRLIMISLRNLMNQNLKSVKVENLELTEHLDVEIRISKSEIRKFKSQLNAEH